ncbi:MAG: heavy metal translocating P-type ATPase [Prevotella sp.]|nr:heavy metal translocating P-type ATPase [Prevotella sp.]
MKKTVPVVGLACSACSAHVEAALRETEGVREASVSLLLRSATIDFDESVTSLEALKAAVNDIGYDLVIDGGISVRAVEERAYKVLKRRVLLAWICAAAVMSVSMHWLRPGDADMSNQVMLLFALLSIIVCGRQIFVSAYKNIIHGHANMDTLVALSTSVTFLFSVFNTFFGSSVWGVRGIVWHTYFDTPAMILAFVLTGRLLEERAKTSTTSAIRELMSIAPTTAKLVKEDADGRETTSEIPVSTIRPGDRLAVGAGCRIPADGVLVRAESFMTADEVYVDESMLTGEPTPAGRRSGDRVYAGTIVSQGSCVVEARLTGTDTAIERITSIVRGSLEHKTPVERATDRAAALFAPAVFLIAAVTFVCWIAACGMSALPTALMAAMAVIVVACPCAMGLATPTALTVGIGRAAKRHILIKDAAALEMLRRIDVLVADKTGTLTIPNPNINFARADNLPYEERETLKANARETVGELQSRGIDVYLMSGDRAEAVEYWAKKTGIRHWQSDVRPGDKEELVRRLHNEGYIVAMIGDGINDTQALAAADVALSVGRGTDVAMDIAQVIIQGDDLGAITDAVDLSRRTMRLVWQNLFWAFIYNIVSIPLAAGVLYIFGIHWSISPMWAALLMALSSISVVANSLRPQASFGNIL